ncbi:MAG TPA: hypothetical protein VLT33_45580 [Labilithrix sp.]|nr:hypothetical protein [Labilithrix sp.]
MSPSHQRLSDDFKARAWQPRPADGKPRRRWFAMGDPQTTFANVLGILRSHDLLGDDGYLRDDVGLVSIGDHFGFASHDERSLSDIGRDGADNLRWLAEHPPDQVVIVMGNHDSARVMELAFETDESFAAARALAAACLAEDAPPETTLAFVAAYPRLAKPGLADRDFSSFAVSQREQVQELLLAGRMRLACVGVHAGKPVLLTHAGVTNAEVKELGVEPTAEALAVALETRLREAVAGVRGAWEHGQLAALDLRPLHFAGEAGHEGGGLLYHRPSNRGDDTGSDKPVARRRFHPRELPRGLVQICGHTGHKKCRKELAEWHAPAPAPRTHGGLRTLAVGESGIVYSESIEPARDGDATYYFIDIEMNAPEVRDYPLLELESVR